ncbi:hypothetical protein T10_6378 [Trichinella papuae]|uniref:Uncharacterized protein n=1 Tax=Trichinella papuae TaxID=268474 RepID=A0A0V1MS11_9BILA|nr:hypothetical protein T10_6378 [Trichinella papuae]
MTVFFLIIQHFPAHVLEEMIFQIHFYVDFRTHLESWKWIKKFLKQLFTLIVQVYHFWFHERFSMAHLTSNDKSVIDVHDELSFVKDGVENEMEENKN